MEKRSPRPPHRVTDENRRLVKALSAVGARQEDIAQKLGCSVDTLARKYQAEYDEGRIDANAKVAQTLYQQAINGNTTAMIFWLKTRARWTDSMTINHVSEDLSMSPRKIEIVPVSPDSAT
jgi:transposase